MRILRYNLDAMAMEGFVPNKNATESSKLDKRSIRFIKDLLPDDDVDCSQLEEAGTLPNIDGYLDFLCNECVFDIVFFGPGTVFWTVASWKSL